MQIELTDEEAQALHETLNGWLGAIAVEIRHTDNPGVRGMLRTRRDSLRKVRDRLVAA